MDRSYIRLFVLILFFIILLKNVVIDTSAYSFKVYNCRPKILTTVLKPYYDKNYKIIKIDPIIAKCESSNGTYKIVISMITADGNNISKINFKIRNNNNITIAIYFTNTYYLNPYTNNRIKYIIIQIIQTNGLGSYNSIAYIRVDYSTIILQGQMLETCESFNKSIREQINKNLKDINNKIGFINNNLTNIYNIMTKINVQNNNIIKLVQNLNEFKKILNDMNYNMKNISSRIYSINNNLTNYYNNLTNKLILGLNKTVSASGNIRSELDNLIDLNQELRGDVKLNFYTVTGLLVADTIAILLILLFLINKYSNI